MEVILFWESTFRSGRVMVSFRSDWREVFVISNSYGMGDSLAFRFEEAGRTVEGGGITRL